MTKYGIRLSYLLVLVAQILLAVFFNFSQFVIMVFLPVMIMCLSTRRSTVYSMVVAFVLGFAVDFFSSGMLGLASVALVPVGAVRRMVIGLVFGSEIFERGEELSFSRLGVHKFVLCVFMLTALYLLVYIWVDGAGTRELWFNAVKFLLSLLASGTVSVFVARILLSDND